MKVAIICEGVGDKTFLEDFIKHLEIETKPNFYVCGGKSNLLDPRYRKYTELKNVVAAEAHKLLFVVDADKSVNGTNCGGLEKTQRALCALITELGLEDASSTHDTYVMHDPTTLTGNLESVILSTISEEQKGCFQSFFSCSKFESEEQHKIILTKIYKVIYPNTPYDFSHSNFDELKNKLLSLFTSE
jgi:hypothetical protein